MKIVPVHTANERRRFFEVERIVYSANKFHRATESDIAHLLIEGPSVFQKHSAVHPFLFVHENETVGRFAIIYDHKLPDWVQVSFFEALAGLPNVAETLTTQAKILFPQGKRMVVGLNGHVNYGVGFLGNRFDEVPVFGLPYTPEYYLHYFAQLERRTMVSFRAPTGPFFDFFARIANRLPTAGITVRKMNRKRLRQEVEIYTDLNNACFPEHPYWANRTADEDFELFNPFRFFLKEENLLFAEYNGKPIAFLLWYPDFNQLVKPDHPLGLAQLLRYRLANPINAWRFTEIGVLPEFRASPAVFVLTAHLSKLIQRTGYAYLEGGFIFEENIPSIKMTRGLFERALGTQTEPYRRYCVFEGAL